MSAEHLQNARDAYRVDHWGEGYVQVNAHGEVCVAPDPARPGQTLSLPALAGELRARGLNFPMLLRFTDVISDRLERIAAAFGGALAERKRSAVYQLVYPIKVNQQREVVETVVEAQARMGYQGLEAGSKPELLIVLAHADPANSTIVCNGYKDAAFVQLALLGQRLGHRVYLVVESLSELDLILEQSRVLGVRPRLGVRVRLTTVAAGNWQNTGGEKSKFGLTATQTLLLLARLEQAQMLDCLEMLHSHIGSQIADLEDVRRGCREAARLFAELWAAGAQIRQVNMGGGLSVDYDGTFSSHYFSMNYRTEAYAEAIVAALDAVCADADLPFPNLITESGRALTAHHAVLVTDVFDVEHALSTDDFAEPQLEALSALSPVHERLVDAYRRLVEAPANYARSLLDWLDDWMRELEVLFERGDVGLEGRAQGEVLHWLVSERIGERLRGGDSPDASPQLRQRLADKLYVNFSLFQSMPDSWGIDQVFPIMPLSGLDRPLVHRARVHDITCDSDGRIDTYVGAESEALPVPAWQTQDPPLFGFFLVGAYQETLGDMHNLFGKVDSVNIARDESGALRFEEVIPGDSVAQVLRAVDYAPEDVVARIDRQIDALPAASERERWNRFIQGQMTNYTYFVHDPADGA